MMKITYEQEHKEWVTELVESWNITDTKDEKELTDFLKKNLIPYNVGYTFKESGAPEGLNINLNIVHLDANFDKMLEFVNELLNIQEKVVKMKNKPKQRILEKVVEQKIEVQKPLEVIPEEKPITEDKRRSLFRR